MGLGFYAWSGAFGEAPSHRFTLPFRTMLEELCREAGFEPNVAYVLRDVTVARAFIAGAGGGLGELAKPLVLA